MASLPHVRPVALTGSDQAVMAAPAVFCGYTIRETAGAAATVRLYDNASAASGTLLATIALAANASVDVSYTRAVWAVNGIYLSKVAGTIEGSVRVG